jgi:diacylglycerol kinase (ATP)
MSTLEQFTKMMRYFFLTLFLCFFCVKGFSLDPQEKKRVSVIVNPIAGKGGKEAIVEQLKQQLGAMGYELEVLMTHAPRHATQLAREALEWHADILVVVGGDGSVNEVGEALVGSDAALAIIPMGSGNGLARHLHIPLNTKDAIDLLTKGEIEHIDTVQINDRSYLGVAGVGFDAEVGWSFATSATRGFFTYFLTVLKLLPGYQPCLYDLIVDGKPISRSAFLISFANSSEFGNGASISPNAQISDGFLDVVIVKKFPFYAAFEMVYRLFRRTLDQSKYVEIIRCKEIDIAKAHLKAHIDGEPMLFPDGIHVRVLPSTLKVIVPKKN